MVLVTTEKETHYTELETTGTESGLPTETPYRKKRDSAQKFSRSFNSMKRIHMFLAFLTTLSTDQRCRVLRWILKNWKRDLAETSLGLILDTIPKFFIRVYTKHEKNLSDVSSFRAKNFKSVTCRILHKKEQTLSICSVAQQPNSCQPVSLFSFLHLIHTHTHTHTNARTPLNEWSARHRSR